MSTVIDPELLSANATAAQRQPLVVLLAAAIAGVVADRYCELAAGVWWRLAIAALLIWLLLFVLRAHRVAFVWLLLGYATGMAAWHHACWHLYPEDEIGRYATLDVTPVCLEAEAMSGVRWRSAPKLDPLRSIPQGDTCQVSIRVLAVRDGTAWRTASGQATLVVDGHLLTVQAGDRLAILALMNRVPPAANPGEFDAAAHERVDRQLVRLQSPSPDCVTILKSGSAWRPRRLLGKLRQTLHRELWQHIHPARAGLAAGLLVGAREQLGYEQTQRFFLTGMIHLLAISGVHVGILAYGFWMFTRTGLLSRRWAIVAAIVFVTLYALITEAHPPVVRAAILVSIFALGRWLGRSAAPLNALAAGGLVVLLMNPTQLFQVGTQLSFLAVATLIYAGPLLVRKRPADPLDRLIASTRPLWWRFSTAAASYGFRLWLTGAVVWTIALPLTMYRFHVMSPAALVLNSLLWLPISLALYFGFATLTIGWLLPPVGAVCGWVCDFLLSFVEGSIAYGERFPGSYQWLPGPALWWVLGFYFVLAIYVVSPRLPSKKLWTLTILVVWTAIGFAASVRSPLRQWTAKEPELRCTFIAVGHGTSVLLEFPDGGTLLYDAGHMGTPGGGAETISAVLWSRGITTLDAVMISHADADHYNALPELLERFTVKRVFVSPVMFQFEPQGVKMLHEAITARHVPIVTLHGGDTLNLGGAVHGEILHPPRRGVPGSDNANSLVLLVEFAGQRILLPGDLETPGLDDVLAELPLHCDMVMAPHHGSARSNPRGFAQWSTPQWVIISGSRARDASVVMDAYRSYGAEVVHTAHENAVQFIATPTSLTVETWQDNAWRVRRHHGAK